MVRMAVHVLAVLTVLLVTPAAAQANGGVTRFVRRAAGPYEVALGTVPPSPGVGNLHLTVTVLEQSTEAQVLDAEVSVTAVGPGPDAAEVGPLRAVNDIKSPWSYDVNMRVDREGEWRFAVSVSAAPGDASAEFVVDVRNASPVAGAITMLVLVALLVVLGLSLRAYVRESGKGAGRRRTRA